MEWLLFIKQSKELEWVIGCRVMEKILGLYRVQFTYMMSILHRRSNQQPGTDPE